MRRKFLILVSFSHFCLLEYDFDLMSKNGDAYVYKSS